MSHHHTDSPAAPDAEASPEEQAATITDVVFAGTLIGVLLWIWAVFFFVL